MNTPDVNTATKIWRWNMNGFGYSSNGINGPYGTAITMDGAIVADFITAGILSANLIKAGTMSLSRLYGDILTIGGNGNRSGKIVVKDSNANDNVIIDALGVTLANGAKLIGGNGVLSNFKYEGISTYKNFLGYYEDTGGGQKTQIQIEAYIPNNFVITSASVVLIHNPICYNDGSKNFWGYCRNIKLYKISNQNIIRYAVLGGEYYDVIGEASLVEIQNGFGGSGFTANAASSSSHNQQIINSIDVKNYIANGQNTLVLQSSNGVPSDPGTDFYNINLYKQTGMVKAVLNVIGYIK